MQFRWNDDDGIEPTKNVSWIVESWLIIYDDSWMNDEWIVSES